MKLRYSLSGVAVCIGLVTAAAHGAAAAPVHLVLQPPVQITTVAPGVVLVDFGRVAFGNLRLSPPPGVQGTVTVHFGEALADGRVNRKPPGTVRYSMTRVTLAGAESIVVAPPPDARNTRQPAAVLTPPEWGVVMPFRWVEIEGWPGELRPEHLRRQAAFASTWDDDAAAFRSSDEMLNRIWELCRYSIKATTFAGVYVDGDRERIPYEADAYLNQLSHYATDHDVQMARDTFDWLMKHPTWPTEWAFHMVFMAHADWMHTGDTEWLRPRYEALKPKLLLDRARADGLLVSSRGADEARGHRGLAGGRARRLRVHAGQHRGQRVPPPRAGAHGGTGRGAREGRARPPTTRPGNATARAAFQTQAVRCRARRLSRRRRHGSRLAAREPVPARLRPGAGRARSGVAGVARRNAAWPARFMPRSTCSKACSRTTPAPRRSR